MCVSEGNVSLSENFANALNEWPITPSSSVLKEEKLIDAIFIPLGKISKYVIKASFQHFFKILQMGVKTSPYRNVEEG